MYGSNLAANNDTLKKALGSLRTALASSLGDNCQSINMIADIEGIVDCIDRKLDQKVNDLILEPNLTLSAELLPSDSVAQQNFTVPAH